MEVDERTGRAERSEGLDGLDKKRNNYLHVYICNFEIDTEGT